MLLRCCASAPEWSVRTRSGPQAPISPDFTVCVILTCEMRNASLGPKPGSNLSISIDSKILEPPFFYLVLIL